MFVFKFGSLYSCLLQTSWRNVAQPLVTPVIYHSYIFWKKLYWKWAFKRTRFWHQQDRMNICISTWIVIHVWHNGTLNTSCLDVGLSCIRFKNDCSLSCRGICFELQLWPLACAAMVGRLFLHDNMTASSTLQLHQIGHKVKPKQVSLPCFMKRC